MERFNFDNRMTRHGGFLGAENRSKGIASVCCERQRRLRASLSLRLLLIRPGRDEGGNDDDDDNVDVDNHPLMHHILPTALNHKRFSPRFHTQHSVDLQGTDSTRGFFQVLHVSTNYV